MCIAAFSGKPSLKAILSLLQSDTALEEGVPGCTGAAFCKGTEVAASTAKSVKKNRNDEFTEFHGVLDKVASSLSQPLQLNLTTDENTSASLLTKKIVRARNEQYGDEGKPGWCFKNINGHGVSYRIGDKQIQTQ
jgi:hypothetical protein